MVRDVRCNAKVRLGGVLTVLVMLLAACGAGGGLSEEQEATVTLGESNAPGLRLTSDFSTSQMLDGRTGDVTSLDEVITGDRPVLMWYWAPT